MFMSGSTSFSGNLLVSVKHSWKRCEMESDESWNRWKMRVNLLTPSNQPVGKLLKALESMAYVLEPGVAWIHLNAVRKKGYTDWGLKKQAYSFVFIDKCS